jgi:hypothetical protein
MRSWRRFCCWFWRRHVFVWFSIGDGKNCLYTLQCVRCGKTFPGATVSSDMLAVIRGVGNFPLSTEEREKRES